MASSDMLYLNLFMAAVVAVYVFGGESPLVSQTTAVAVGLTQAFLLLSGGVAYVASPAPKKVEDCCDEEEDWVAFLVSQVTMLAQSARCQCIAGLSTVLLLGRVLRTTSILSATSQAIPLGFVFGILVSYVAKRRGHNDQAASNTQGRDKVAADKLDKSATPFVDSFGNESDPDFFGKLEPQAIDLADEVKLDSSEILSDVLLDLMLEKQAVPASQVDTHLDDLVDMTGMSMDSFFDDHDHDDGDKSGESTLGDDGDKFDDGASPSSAEFLGKHEPQERPIVDEVPLDSSEILSDVLLGMMFEKK